MRLRHRRKIKAIKIPPTFLVLVMALSGGALLWVLSASGADQALNRVLRDAAEDSALVRDILDFEMTGGLKNTAEVFQETYEDSSDYAEDEIVPEIEMPAALPEDNYRAGEDVSITPEISESPMSLSELKPELNLRPVTSITINPTGTKGYDQASGVFIKNDTSYNVDVAALLKTKPDLKISGNGPHVLIVHTHGSEAYTPEGADTYTPDDNDRTLDKNFNVIRVGDEMEKELKAKGISVVHIREIFDSPSYVNSYSRSLQAITEQMKKTPSIKMVIDIHRDAMITASGIKYKTVAKVADQTVSQMMFVMGTNEGGLPHKDWKSNLILAVHLQQKINEKYPGLMRPINLRRERFNQHVTKGSLLIEIGTCGNTLNESLASAKLFAGVLADELKQLK